MVGVSKGKDSRKISKLPPLNGTGTFLGRTVNVSGDFLKVALT